MIAGLIYTIYIICNIQVYKFLSCVAKCKCYYLACVRSESASVIILLVSGLNL